MSKGKELLDDFLHKVGKSMAIIREKNTITVDELSPAWEARKKLEAYLEPPRDKKGHFIKQAKPTNSNNKEK